MKYRRSADGIHFFDRRTGLNLLFDEVTYPPSMYARAPRFVSIALTNRCDLHCPFCYAPKLPATLAFDEVVRWSRELDENGTLGIGFGGGEPTLYPQFARLCRTITESTTLGISFTTHAHHLTNPFCLELMGNVHFVRVSMDGVGPTYERIRNRSFAALMDHLRLVSTLCRFGINYVVTDDTVADLDNAADIALRAGAIDFLLLPEHSATGLNEVTRDIMVAWASENYQRIRLSIAETGISDVIPLADPFTRERGTKAYVHVNALGKVTPTSYVHSPAIAINPNEGILAAISELEGAVL